MKVLNAAAAAARTLTPHPKRKQHQITKRPLTGALGIGLASLSSLLASGPLSKALSYDEAINQSLTPSVPSDLRPLLDFASDNALLFVGGAAAIAVPLVLSRILGSARAWGTESARSAYRKLGEDASAALVDIRDAREAMATGGPDLSGVKKKAVAVAYDGKYKNVFLKKLAAKFKDPGSTTLFILDKFDGNSELVAELVTANGFKAAFAIKDGAEGA